MARNHMRYLMAKNSCNLGFHGRPLQQLQQARIHDHLSSWNYKCIDLIAVNDSKLPLQALQLSLSAACISKLCEEQLACA